MNRTKECQISLLAAAVHLHLYVTVVAITHCQEHQDQAVILSGPRTQVVAVNDKSSFNCHAWGSLVYWQINKSVVSQDNMNDYRAKGFQFVENEIENNNIHNNTITIEANSSNNNTVISCTAVGQKSDQIQYQEAFLIIAGPPLAPSVSLTTEHTINNTFTFNLTWSTPFSWPGYPIIKYEVTMTNYSSGKPIQNTTTMTVLESSRNHNITEYYHIEFTGQGNGCYNLSFLVTASNSIGKGDHSIVKSGQPIDLVEIGNIETTVTFPSDANATPHFWMSFIAPTICPGYQTGFYNITVYDSYGNVVKIFSQTEYTQETEEEPVLIVKGVRSGLILNEQYIVAVTVESLGVYHHQRKNFSTNYARHCSSSMDHAQTQSSCLPSTGSVKNDKNQQTLVMGISTGGIILVSTCIIVIMLVVLCKCTYKRKRLALTETDGDPKSLRITATHSVCKMQINPIYEGPVYDTIPGESFKPLLASTKETNTTVPETDENYTSRYANSLPRCLPPARHTQLSHHTSLEAVHKK